MAWGCWTLVVNLGYVRYPYHYNVFAYKIINFIFICRNDEVAFLLYAIYGFSGTSVETPARYIKQWVSCMTPLTVDVILRRST